MTYAKMWHYLRRACQSEEHGQVLVLMALALLALIGVTGLAIDVGLVMQGRRELVRMTDAAALAAAGALSGDPNDSDEVRKARATQRAREYTLLHGFNPDAEGITLSVTFPVTSPPRKLVEVQATRQVPLAFMRAFGIDHATVSSGGRQGEAAPVDIVLLQDVSASQCEQNYNPDTSGDGWCSRLQRPGYPGQYYSVPWPYHPAEVTTSYDWPPRSTPGYRTNVPWKPFYEQQYAARYFVDRLDPRYDQVALVSFSSATNDSPYGGYANEARVHYGLTNNFGAVKDTIGLSPIDIGRAGDPGLFPAGQTNMAKGIQVAMNVLTSDPRARENAIGAIILLSDGSPTRTIGGSTPSGCSSSKPGACVQPRRDVKTQTEAAAQAGVVIYTVFTGSAEFAENHALTLQWIADLTDNGRLDGEYNSPHNFPTGYRAYDTAWFQANVSNNFYLASSYDQLEAAYESILNKIYTRLVE